ncbi:DUF4276 family protein [Candidatus Amarolinea dominans]|uniref:DUF4276 family protein n=1 Tax=Candidatus Amarolinea dominans TaxID=3140696 RepID=UPI003135AC7F|nr:DUF4276 family protein [Anaerolineae bacterium]
MREITLFVEDHAHYEFLKALIQRLAREHSQVITLDWRNVRRGHSAVIQELKQFLRDLARGRGGYPDLVVVATDANCRGIAQRVKEIREVTDATAARVICAVPDPHVERWLLVDSAAFKAVLGRGCAAPDQKCERARYKRLLIEAIRQAGITPNLGGIEFAADIVAAMDLGQASRLDPSLQRFLDEMNGVFREWRS